jgi:4-hydroxybenzoate polyprenyltransferase
VMFIYNLNRITDTTEDRINVPKRIDFVRKWGQMFMTAGTLMLIAAISIALMTSFGSFLIIMSQLAISVLYSIFRLKKRYILKNLVVAFAWGMTPVMVGAYFNLLDIRIMAISIFFLVEFFINTVIFDIKDVKGDYLYKIRTLPTVIGIKNTKHACLIINIFSGLILLLSIIYQILPITALLLTPLLFYVFIYIMICDRKDGLFYGLFVDGEFMFLALFILLAYMVVAF